MKSVEDISKDYAKILSENDKLVRALKELWTCNKYRGRNSQSNRGYVRGREII